MGLIHKMTFVPRFMRQLFYKPFNRLFFKSAGCVIGRNFLAYNRVYLKVYRNANVVIGDNFTLRSGDGINPISGGIKTSIFVNENASLVIGNGVGMSSPTIRCNESIEIRDNVNIGALVTIIDTDSHSLDYRIRRIGGETDTKAARNKPILIEEDCLIGAHSIILKGVTIGARSIIGAGSVVTRDIPSDSIAAGNPCKVIKKITN